MIRNLQKMGIFVKWDPRKRVAKEAKWGFNLIVCNMRKSGVRLEGNMKTGKRLCSAFCNTRGIVDDPYLIQTHNTTQHICTQIETQSLNLFKRFLLLFS